MTINTTLSNLSSQLLMDRDYIRISGTASANVKIRDYHFTNRVIFDFSELDFNGYNLQIDDCTNIAIYKPYIDMGETDDHAIKLERCTKVIIDSASTNKGQNGIFITDSSTECFVHDSVSIDAAIDGMTCHSKSGGSYPCGNKNVFYNCRASGGEEGFDAVSGLNHYFINCVSSSTSGNNSLFLGRDSSASIINFTSIGFKIYLTNCSAANIVGGNFRKLVFRTHSDGSKPQNVKYYGSPLPDTENIEGLDLSTIYTTTSDGFVNPDQSWINNTLSWIQDNLR